MERHLLVNNQNGSALIESLFVLLNMGVVVTAVATAIYLSFAKTWIHFSLYEGLYCIAEQKDQTLCKQHTQRRIDRLIPLPKNTHIDLRKSGSQFIGKISLAKIHDPSWQQQINRRLFDYELQIQNPSDEYRSVR